jgi:hypothetical protein
MPQITRTGKSPRKQYRNAIPKSLSLLTLSLLLLVAGLLLTLTGVAEQLTPSAAAASPSSGTISPANPVINYTGGPFAVSNPSSPIGENPPVCTPDICSQFALTVDVPEGDSSYVVNVRVGWTNGGTTTQGNTNSDYDLYIYKPDVTSVLMVARGGGQDNPESATFDAEAGTYTIYVVPYDVAPDVPFSGAITLSRRSAGPRPTPSPALPPGSPRYFAYAPPSGLGAIAGEPTIGVNWNTGKVMFIAFLETLQVTFDDSSSPAKATWLNKPAINTTARTLDPILFTDGDIGPTRTNRTFASQLLGKASAMAFTDDDGETWTPSQGSGINSGVDHQTIGGGPYARNADGTLKGNAIQRPGPDGKIYPHAIYYASQDIGLAQIARSDDGGFTFGVAVPMYNLTQCSGLHGQIKVAGDGTVYIPVPDCNGQQGLAVSTDNGMTWAVRTIPGSTSSASDPSVGIGTDGTLYYGYADADDSTPKVAVSTDRGQTWLYSKDVGAAAGIKNVAFPAVVAGDGDRAAMFFLGSLSGGSEGVGEDLGAFDGSWFGYIATTYDRGQTWVTVLATPNDPVQLGPICGQGTLCADGSRELLDFNDATVDKQGRVLAAFADGCITAGCIQGVDKNGDGRVNGHDNDQTQRGAIIRQSGGRGLFAAYDGPLTTAPAAPQVVASKGDSGVNLSWTTPDNGGSEITGYKVYRGAQGLPATLVATVGGDVHSFADTTTGSNYYQVSAVNAVGEGARSAAAIPAVIESPCKAPGVTVLTDSSDAAPNTPPVASANIKSLHVAEPYADGASKLVFTVKLGAGAFPANSQLYVIWNRLRPDEKHDRNYVAMKTDLTGARSFEHGRVNHGLTIPPPPEQLDGNHGNIPTRFGAAEGTYDPVTGVLTITIANDKVDNPTAGQSLLGLEVRTFVGRNDSLLISQSITSDFAAGGNYQLAGNNSCLLPPSAPTALAASSPVKAVINLSWSDNSADEDSFLIERSTSPDGGFEQIATARANATGYTDTSIQRRVTYYYRVRAAKGVTRSGYSNVASARTK